jgi:hypothetical protein
MMLSCKDAHRLASRHFDGELGWYDRVRLGLHLRICTACAAFGKQMAFLRRAVRELGSRLP